MARSHRKSFATPQFHASAFGGWGDYQSWADHDFRPKGPDDETAPETTDAPEPEIAAGGHHRTHDDEDLDDLEDLRRLTDGADDYADDSAGGYADEDSDEHAIPGWPAEEPAYPEEFLYHPAYRVPTPRPYVRTGGRTRATQELRIETLVSVTAKGSSGGNGLRAEYSAICRMCQTPASIAEIAAHLRVPIGVARVLVSDAIDWQLVAVHEVRLEQNNRPSIDLMHKVLAGLHRMG